MSTFYLVDCTKEENDKLCRNNGVEGFPTLKYGDPEFLEVYEGSREFEEMYSFATTSLQVACSPKHLDACNDDDKAVLEEMLKMSYEDLKKVIDDFDAKVNQMEETFDNDTEGLEAEYMEMMKVNKVTKPTGYYGIIKSIQAMRQQGSGNDEL